MRDSRREGDDRGVVLVCTDSGLVCTAWCWEGIEATEKGGCKAFWVCVNVCASLRVRACTC